MAKQVASSLTFPLEASSPIALPPAGAEWPEREVIASTPYQVGTLAYTPGNLRKLFGWLFWGDLAWQIKDRSVGTVFQLLIKQFHASDLICSLLLVSVPQIIGISMGPYISTASDRHRGRFGRRIPFILVPAPFAALSIIALGLAPMLGRWVNSITGGSPGGIDRWVLLFFGIFWVMFDITTTVANSAFGPLVNDVVPPGFLGRFYGAFRAISLLAGIVFNLWVLGIAGKYYLPVFVGAGLIYGLGVPLMCWKVKEGSYPPPGPIDSKARSPVRFYVAFAVECFSKPYYLFVFAAIILPNLGMLPLNTFNLYFAQSVGASARHFGHLTALSFTFSLALTFPTAWMVDRFHSLRMAAIALALHAAATLWGSLYIHDQATFAIAFVVTNTLAGVWLTSTAPLTSLLLPRMKFAQYGCALGILNSALNLILAPMVGTFLDHHNHQYHYTYLIAFVLEAAGLVATLILLHWLVRYGGPDGCVVPE